MTYHSIRKLSYSTSFVLHVVLILLLMLIKYSIDYTPKNYVELSFGTTGKEGSSGAMGTKVEKVENLSKTEDKNETQDKSQEVKEVQLPEAKQTEEENVVKPADKNKEETTATKTESKQETNSKVTSEGQGNKAKGEGSFGFDIDWGGKGKRKIYSYTLPNYPEGVQKEVDIRLRFTILPDGTVGTILPLIKADTKLENAAINSLRQWRFEPLAPTQKQVEQTAVIVFPYRLQ